MAIFAGRGRSGAKSAGLRPMTRASAPAARARSVIVSSARRGPRSSATAPVAIRHAARAARERRPGQEPKIAPHSLRAGCRSSTSPCRASPIADRRARAPAARRQSRRRNDDALPDLGRHQRAVVVDDGRHEPVVLTGRLARDRCRRIDGALAELLASAPLRCRRRGGEERKMVRSLERDERGAIRRRRRGRSRLGSKRRRQPLAKATRSVRTAGRSHRGDRCQARWRARPRGARRWRVAAATYATTSARTPGWSRQARSGWQRRRSGLDSGTNRPSG